MVCTAGLTSFDAMDHAGSVQVVFVVIDALPNQWVGPVWTPHLWAVAGAGGWNPDGGRAVLTTATYPNHASFVTGREPAEHGILANRVWDGDGFTGSWRVGPAGSTLFTAAKAGGVSSAIVVGDHKLIGVMGGERADTHWPPAGRRADVPLDEFRYAADTSVLAAVDEVDALAAEMVVVHFNEPDTACHLHGPDAPETGERVRRTDAVFGELLERLRANWDDTVLMVVSDHDQERVTAHGFDLAAVLDEAGLPGVVENEGTAAVVRDGPGLDVLRALDGIEDGRVLDADHTMVWGPPGQVFGPWLDELHGSHGSPRCATQVAVVGGGHGSVPSVASAVAAAPPRATAWAPMIAGLLGIELSAAV